jgi:hypothetical protein
MNGDMNPPFTADEDYAWVKWASGATFHFPAAMRRVVAKLFADYLAGKPSSDGKELLKLSNSPTMEKTFKVRTDGRLVRHPAWGTMIVHVSEPGGKGRYRVRNPDLVKTSRSTRKSRDSFKRMDHKSACLQRRRLIMARSSDPRDNTDRCFRSLNKVRGRFPGTRKNASLHLAMIRCCTRGIRQLDGSKIRLGAVRVGSRWLTTDEWVDEFISALTAAHSPDDKSHRHRSPAQLTRSSVAAAEELAQKYWL